MKSTRQEQQIGLDISKSVFQVHIEDGSGQVVAQRRLRRSQMEPFFGRQPASMIALEACGSSHYWARRLEALGHRVRLIPAAYVKPFVRRNKTDARDAAAICTALKQPDMRFVAIKSPDQQAARGLERSRELLVKQRTQLLNSVRGQMAEQGLIAAKGERGFAGLTALLAAGADRLPDLLMPALRLLVEQIGHLTLAIEALEKQILARVKADPDMRRLLTIPGVGPILAHAIVAAIGDGRQFASARDFAAWAGLTASVHATAGKARHKAISRQGDSRLRKLFALGASTIMRHVKTRPERATAWQRGIFARRPVKVAVLAQAAKNARIAWAVLTSGGLYQPHRQADTIAQV